MQLSGHCRRHSETGAAAVEFALVVWVLIIILLGIIQFGYTFFEYIQVVHAAREGVRWASVGKTDTEIIARAKAAAPGLEPAAMVVTPSTVGTDAVRVTVSYPRTSLVPVPGAVLPATITSRAEMRLE